MCDCAQDIPAQPGTYSQEGPCTQITSDTLTLYLSLIRCIITRGDYMIAGTNAKECETAVKLITDWGNAKQEGSDECDFFRHMPIFQELVKRIILTGRCL